MIQAYDALEELYEKVVGRLMLHDPATAEDLAASVPDIILTDNLHGVDLFPQAVEITQLALWIRSARRNKTLAILSANIIQGNSLVSDPSIDAKAVDWAAAFPKVFSRAENPGFDCVIGNPPWERLKVQEREFFAFSAPEIAGAVSAATRREKIAELQAANPDLYAAYRQAQDAAERTVTYSRTSGQYPLTGRGDINTYMLFAELAQRIVAPKGRVGLLVPSGIATDATTKEFFSGLMESQVLIRLYDFENKAPAFPDVHRSFKFCILVFGGREVTDEIGRFRLLCASSGRPRREKTSHRAFQEGPGASEPYHADLPDLPQPPRRRNHQGSLSQRAGPDRPLPPGGRQSLGHPLLEDV